MRLSKKFRGHLQVMKRVASRKVGVSAEQIEYLKISARLDQEQPLKLGHPRRLQTLLPSIIQPEGRSDGSILMRSTCGPVMSATSTLTRWPSTSNPKSIGSGLLSPAAMRSFTSR